jgi:N-acetylmuramoyl-L-alanine amidase
VDASAKLIKKHQLEMYSEIKNGKQHTNNIYMLKLIILFLVTMLVSASGAEMKDGKKWIIVIDAGHGGKDPGAIGSMSREKDIVLAIALKTGHYIEKNIPNAEVIYTRKTDSFPELRDRANIANKNKADLFISIHANWAKQKNVRGAETYVMGVAKDQQNLEVAKKENEVILLENDHSTKYEGFDPKSEVSYVMFSLTQKVFQEQSIELASLIQKEFRERVNRNDRDVKQAGFWVLFTTTMPSVLVETGFITNPAEEKFLNSSQGQDYLASAIYRACKQYINEIESKSGISWDKNQPDIKVTGSSGLTDINPDATVFKVQIATSATPIEVLPDNFKGLKDVVELPSNGLYKYASGTFSDYESASSYRKKIESSFPDAFVIAVKNYKILPLQEALETNKLK